jgi:hypothetical protein
MRDSPVVTALAVILFIIGAAALAAFVKSRNQPIYQASPKMIACDPEFFENKLVRLKTPSMEVCRDEQGAVELRYREATDKPYCVIVRGRIPDPVPEFLVCHCDGPQGIAVVLTVR